MNQNTLSENQKNRLRNGAIKGSRYYNRYLLNKEFTIITDDYICYSITFKKRDFCHFTGLTISHITENDFFDICVEGTLSNSNIKNVQYYNYKTLKTKNESLMKLNKFLHADASTNLFISGLVTNTTIFSCAIRNDKENMAICFTGKDNHARSLRKANNSHNVQNEKQIIAIFEKINNKLDKSVYIRNKKDIINNISNDIFSANLKKFLHIL